MSNPFESGVVEEGTGDPDLWFNLAPALLLGGLLPLGVSMLSGCAGLSILTWPITLLLTLAGGALGGASIHHRRGGAMSGRDLVRASLGIAALQNLPIFCLLPMPLFFVTAEQDAALLVGGSFLGIALVILFCMVYVGVLAAAGFAGGFSGARQGLFGPSWQNGATDASVAAQPSAGWFAIAAFGAGAVVVGVPLFAIVIIGALTVLGGNISKKFETIAASVQAAEQDP